MKYSLVGIGTKLLLDYIKRSQQRQPQGTIITEKDLALINLKKKDGAVVLILGRRDSGKTVLAHRIAEFLERPVYAVSPEEKPPDWITEIKLEDVERVPVNSTLIMDDLPVYMSSRDYSEALVRNIEKIIPVVRHPNKRLMLIFVSQTSGYADRWVMDADAVFLKQGSILYADIERPAVKKLMDKAAPYFSGQNEYWLKRHAYLVTDSWEGIIGVTKVT